MTTSRKNWFGVKHLFCCFECFLDFVNILSYQGPVMPMSMHVSSPAPASPMTNTSRTPAQPTPSVIVPSTSLSTIQPIPSTTGFSQSETDLI